MALSKITNLSITDDAVRTVGIQDNNVTLAKLGDGTQGDILYYGASGAPARLGFGTSGDFLKTQGTGANPVWATAAGGKVLQVIESKFTTDTSTSSASYVATGHIGTITPSATTSKILVQLSLGNTSVGMSALTMDISLYLDIAGAGYNEIIGGDDPWFRIRGSSQTGGGTNQFLNSPSTTSACNYQIYFLSSSGAMWYQNSGDDYGLNNLILMEIGA